MPHEQGTHIHTHIQSVNQVNKHVIPLSGLLEYLWKINNERHLIINITCHYHPTNSQIDVSV